MVYKCKICGEKYTTVEGLYAHLENKHHAIIPPDMSVEQYYYYLKTGRTHGNCVMCKKPTRWNDKTKKYHRFCDDPVCKQEYKKVVDQRMIGKYGKVSLLNDPEHQRKMMLNRSISGVYDFNGVSKPYVGSYELDFLKTMDLYFNWDPNDIEMPSPHTYYYMYEGEKKFYIPDAYIYSLNLEIEIKDGGNNPNKHPKIQNVDKVKEKLKDDMMANQKQCHYIKITNKNYKNLIRFFEQSKSEFEKYESYDKIPPIIITEDLKTTPVNGDKLKREIVKNGISLVNEGYEIVNEAYACYNSVNNIVTREYKTVKDKMEYEKEINNLKNHFINGINRIETKEDAEMMMSDIDSTIKYLHDLQFANRTRYINMSAAYDIEQWLINIAKPMIKNKKFNTSNDVKVNEYLHTIDIYYEPNKKILFGPNDTSSHIIIDNDVKIVKKAYGGFFRDNDIDIMENYNRISLGTNDDFTLNDDDDNRLFMYMMDVSEPIDFINKIASHYFSNNVHLTLK